MPAAAQGDKPAETSGTTDTAKVETKELQVNIKTNQGAIQVTLFPDKAPMTVANFLNLAQRKYYDGIVFHRVIPNFMIQGGDPTGTGRGGPGYKFKDECVPELVFDKPGLLAMANAGPGTNGSQFFVTHVPTPWLNGKHTIFGAVKSGQDVVDKIKQGDKIESIEIIGDYSSLFDSQKAQLEEWNKILDANKK
ncbi:MAG: peptidylprolyl isomerase [Candidatus Omnitrophica bacterium]|nr:peptidylprolyl isomerase [bacterium]MBW7938072.1 peptidylprolyl isomerase [Candidatus Omnitrophota bacterium]MCC6731920.1 peptidylprolyl isomerase [Candidatus Omnitrophota bacterium]MCE7909449.1 peptidylprolyl isomerase [Candidatus Omnitrophica bacterium COP1]